MELKIEKNVPIPQTGGNTGLVSVLRKLEIGDSVLVKGRHHCIANTAQYVFGSGNYTTRKVDGESRRVWRIK
jgi:hypothetical protein